jgi:zinc/manganese transport system substrate-binding protein
MRVPRWRSLSAVKLAVALPVAVALGGALAGCAGTSAAGTGAVRVVVAENFWGSITGQLAGSKASVTSIIVDPAQDPHSYEPTAADARTLATARLVIANSIGYDPWVQRLLNANPNSGRQMLTVGNVLGLKAGDNPHRWYDPANVEQVANAITAALKKVDPHDSGYFDQQRRVFETRGLAQYHQAIAQIRRRYAGVPVGASESIFALQAPALGLHLVTPPSFMKAISEGTDVNAQDIRTVQRQISSHQIKVWVYNSQNATPEIQHLNALARAAGIPVATITETLSPPTASFQQWQAAELTQLAGALRQATGR